MTIDKIIEIGEAHRFQFHEYIENDVLCGYEVIGRTNCGVEMIHFVDCRKNNYPDGLTAENVMEELKAISANFNVDEQIDIHRQDTHYVVSFGIRESVVDFENYEGHLTNFVRQVVREYDEEVNPTHTYDIAFSRAGNIHIQAKTKEQAVEIAKETIEHQTYQVNWWDDGIEISEVEQMNGKGR